MLSTALIVTHGEEFRALVEGAGAEGLPVYFNKRIVVRPSDGWWRGIVAPGYVNGRVQEQVFHVASLVQRAQFSEI